MKIVDRFGSRPGAELVRLPRGGERLLAVEHAAALLVNEQTAFRVVCTPELLPQLALGRLLTEGWIASADEVEQVAVCAEGLKVSVHLTHPLAAAPAAGQEVPSCCTDNLTVASPVALRPLAPVPQLEVPEAWVGMLAAAMGGELPLYRATRAVHSCFLLRAGRILYQCEDLGRHNALDKAVGCALADGVPLGECIRTASRQEAREMMAALAAWTDAFEREYHRRTGQTAVLEDLSPGNFLWDAASRKITGLDFEFWHTGSPAENRGGLLCMAERLKAAEITGEELTGELYRQFRGGFDRAELEHRAARARQQTALRQRAMPLIRQTAGVILAGGQSRRMGSPKALLPWKDGCFLDQAIDTLWVFDRLLLSANEPVYRQFGCPVLEDRHRGIGPLGALHTALLDAGREWVFLLPCDMPYFRTETVLELFAQADPDRDEACIFSAGGHLFPTVGLYSRRLLPAVERQIASGEYRLRDLFAGRAVRVLPAGRPGEFVNVNTPGEYQALLTI